MITDKYFMIYKNRLRDSYFKTFLVYQENVIYGCDNFVDESCLDWFSSDDAHILYDNFKSEYENIILSNIDNVKLLRGYLLKIYVNGFYLHLIDLKDINNTFYTVSDKTGKRKIRYENIKNDRVFKSLYGRMYATNLLLDEIRLFVLKNAGYKMSEIDSDKFNSGKTFYLGDFELISENNNHNKTVSKTVSKGIKNKVIDLIDSYNFNKLEKIKNLSEESKNKLIKCICENNTPFIMAMFEYLDFFEKIKNNRSSEEMFQEISDSLNIGVRAVKGNYYVLNPKTTENKKRYTSHLYKEKVDELYTKLKLGV